MHIYKVVPVMLLAVNSCAYALDNREPKASGACDQIRAFSKNVALGERRNVRLSILPTSEGRPQKFCRAEPLDELGRNTCRYLSEHTSSERLAGNIYQMLSCITGASGPTVQNAWTAKMMGKVIVSEPFAGIKNVEIELSYSFVDSGSVEDYFDITAMGVAGPN